MPNMNKSIVSILLLGLLISISSTMAVSAQQKGVETLRKGWYFTRTDNPTHAQQPASTAKGWQTVTVPHDWAIYGPFSISNDMQHLAIAQDGQKKAMEHAGRTGGLPFVGVGWYQTTIELPHNIRDKYVELRFDGAMSHAQVFLNGKKLGQWPYGYNSFYLDLTPHAHPGKNLLAVRLENLHESSRWYPGAGIYRDVHLRITDKTRIKTWGVQLQTPFINKKEAGIQVNTTIINEGGKRKHVDIHEEILAPNGKRVWQHMGSAASTTDTLQWLSHAKILDPAIWDLDSPHLYRYCIALKDGANVLDADTLTFGIRDIALKANEGFYLNGRKIRFKGVCLHHDQGPLGAEANEASMRRQIRIMKEMGANAIRTSHNMPDPKFVQICNEMGMMVAIETFDSWTAGKVPNGYNLDFDRWHERDLVNMLHQYRNSPSVMMYFIGNEVVEQTTYEGAKMAYQLQSICHREDPTRPVCNGMDNLPGAIDSGMAGLLDIPGFNYRVHLYPEGHKRLPQGFILGSETASTLSSRGIYKFPVQRGAMKKYPDQQASSYDVEHCSWSSLPEDNWMIEEDNPWVMGEFVWTGFDYLGEPTPYYDNWPSHSSLFGIVDLAGIPKDRYYLYRSHWNKNSHTLHMLPHWTWPGREGKVTPVFVYTDYPEAELFINGKSQGRIAKDKRITWEKTENKADKEALTRLKRYRLMWPNTVYEPGTVKVVAYNEQKQPADSLEMRTAGKAQRIDLAVDRQEIKADGRDIAFVTVTLLDNNGTPCLTEKRKLNFRVTGAATFRAAASGDPTSLELFHLPTHQTFSGQLTVLVQSSEREGEATLWVSGDGLETNQIKIITKH